MLGCCADTHTHTHTNTPDRVLCLDHIGRVYAPAHSSHNIQRISARHNQLITVARDLNKHARSSCRHNDAALQTTTKSVDMQTDTHVGYRPQHSSSVHKQWADSMVVLASARICPPVASLPPRQPQWVAAWSYNYSSMGISCRHR